MLRVKTHSFTTFGFLAIFFVLFLDSTNSGSYIYSYLVLVTFLCAVTLQIQGVLRVFSIFVLFYLAIGLLNISTWRGYTSQATIDSYSWSVFLLFLPMIFIAPHSKRNFKTLGYNQNFIIFIVLLHLTVSYFALLFVIAKYGNLLVNPHKRFLVSTELGYIIRSLLAIPPIIPFLRIKRRSLLLILTVLPAVFIGSRASAVVAIIAYIIVAIYREGSSLSLSLFYSKNKKFILYFIAVLGIISVLFYLRRGGPNGYSPIDFVMLTYFDYDNVFIRSILPFYLGFKETIGITGQIIDRNLTNEFLPYSLFVADLYTVFPGDNLAAGQSLRLIFGSTQSGGLTPGLLGGLYIDFRVQSLIIFFFLGLALSIMQVMCSKSAFALVILAQTVGQTIHLFHRGFLKPEYVTVLLITYFYFILCHKLRL